MNLDSLVLKWVKSIDIMNVKSNSCITQYQKIFRQNPDAIFISFNYTRVLEDLYNIKEDRILHIHGDIDNIPIMGHGKDHLYNYDDEISTIDEEFIKAIHGGFCDFYNSSKKNISQFSENLISFIKSYDENNFEKILVIGHSLGNVDIPYFRKLNQIVPNIDWKITYFGNHDLERKKSTIKKLNLSNLQLIQSIIDNSII